MSASRFLLDPPDIVLAIRMVLLKDSMVSSIKAANAC